QAEAFLHDDLQPIYTTLKQWVKVPLNQGQFDALCSFIFNCGSGNFLGSTLLKKLNQGDYTGTAAEFSRWNKATGKVMRGLDNRRASEARCFYHEVQFHQGYGYCADHCFSSSLFIPLWIQEATRYQ
ncbi:lysozyme, partial [Xenorhabdus sp. 12]